MATVYELGEIIARRRIAVRDSDAEVEVLLGRPRPVTGGGYVCAFQIVGLDDDCVQPAGGDDAMQALQQALKMIAAVLHTSDPYRARALSWGTDRELGFEPFTQATAQLGRRFGDEEELREVLRAGTRLVVELVRGETSVADFMQRYARFYHWADLAGDAAAEERRLLDAYADVIAFHNELRPVFAEASTADSADGKPSEPAPSMDHDAIDEQIKTIADKYDLRRWILELSRPTPTLH